MAKKKKKINFFAEETNLEIPMTQMIDCVFLLLIFFMSVSTIDDMRQSKKVQLPVAKDAVADEDESNRLIIDVEWDESQYNVSLRLSGQVYREAGEMIPLLERFSKKNPVKGKVVIRADRKVPYEFTQEVLSAVADANIPSVMFSTLEVELPVKTGRGGA